MAAPAAVSDGATVPAGETLKVGTGRAGAVPPTAGVPDAACVGAGASDSVRGTMRPGSGCALAARGWAALFAAGCGCGPVGSPPGCSAVCKALAKAGAGVAVWLYAPAAGRTCAGETIAAICFAMDILGEASTAGFTTQLWSANKNRLQNPPEDLQ